MDIVDTLTIHLLFEVGLPPDILLETRHSALKAQLVAG